MASAEFITLPRALLACIIAALAAVGLARAPEAEASARMSTTERNIVRHVNALRRERGLARLRAIRSLARSADYHCKDMLRANFFAHPSSNGTSAQDRVKRYRPSTLIGETLAYMPLANPDRSAARIVAMWMDSPPHRDALMSSAFRRIGVASRKGTLGGMPVAVYTADLASRR